MNKKEIYKKEKCKERSYNNYSLENVKRPPLNQTKRLRKTNGEQWWKCIRVLGSTMFMLTAIYKTNWSGALNVVRYLLSSLLVNSITTEPSKHNSHHETCIFLYN